MELLLISVAFLLVGPSLAGEIPPGGVCTPGSSWKKECNWCTCTSNGMGSFCTLKGCPQDYQPDPTEKQCEAGSKWKVGCNTCECYDGQPRCTERICTQGDQNVGDDAGIPPGAKCKPGSRWMRACNWCTCSENGMTIACTTIFCGQGYHPSPDKKQCETGSKWTDDCNTCTCEDEKILCTEKACIVEQPELQNPRGPQNTSASEEPTITHIEVECTQHSRWRKECNWCRCRYGRELCTKHVCSSESAERRGPECGGDSRWKKDCNWCYCVNGTGICATKACNISTEIDPDSPQVTVTEEEPECTEGSRWREDCNLCTCSQGKGACTRQRCIPGRVTVGAECEGNSTWTRDCNKCTCVDGIALCTLKRCPTKAVTLERPDPEACEEGAAWAEGCIRCECRNGVPACTEHLCRDPSVDLNQRQTTRTCIRGTSWKEDCNTCECVNGLPACTKRLCPYPHNEAEPPSCINGTIWTQDCNRCECYNNVSQCTRRLCPEIPVDQICNDPAHQPDVEQCKGFDVFWTYDSIAGKCVEIVYGGCGGTANLFESKAACKERCVRTSRREDSSRLVIRASKPERCTYELERGPCFGMLISYGYNTDTGRCEQFMYGGCQGNGNNFETAAECQQVCGGGPPVSDPKCDRSQCPWKRWAHYIAKNCQPQYEEDSCCPTSFSCPQADELKPDLTKCYYKGAVYEVGDNVPVDEKCSASCRCAPGHNVSEIHCANIECPELFTRPSPDCRLLYKPDTCCSYDTECGIPPELETRSTACTWNNKTYRQGDKMYFDDFPCQYCVCTPEFTSPTGPGCSKIDCGFEFRYTSRMAEGCVPVFFEQKCCPINWMCPGDSRLKTSASESQSQKVSSQTAQCHLGELSVPVGTKVPTTDCNIDCRCSTPPELTCVQYRSCELAEDNQPKDCPEIKCPVTCRTVIDSVTGCPKCSCSEHIYTCDKKECPAGCGKDVDPKTGCPSCQCLCPKDPSGRPPCPADCATRFVTDEATGCEICECDPTKPVVIIGRPQCPAYPQGRPPCPQDCATRIVIDERTGCLKCECDPDDPGNPFEPPPPSDCPKDHTGRAPCPMDCAVRVFTDPTSGCERCECDPDSPGNPFNTLTVVRQYYNSQVAP